jgi:hypothetical protein
MTGPIRATPAELHLMDQVQAAVSDVVGAVVEHWSDECDARPKRCCIGVDVSAYLDGLTRDQLRMVCEEALIQLAERRPGSTIRP